MDNNQLPQLQLLPPKNDLSDAEAAVIEEIFSNPLIVRYLNILLWNNIVDEANIPLDTFLKETQEHIVKVAFIKGGTSMLQTLLSMSINRARRLEEEAQARANERNGNG